MKTRSYIAADVRALRKAIGTPATVLLFATIAAVAFALIHDLARVAGNLSASF